MWRSFDTGTVVQSLGRHDFRLVAGASGLQRPVSSARLIETTEELRRVAGGELLVTTASVLAGAGDRWEELVARLDAAGVAGVVVQTDDEPAGELLAVAERRALPVFVVPAALSLAAARGAILDALLEAERAGIERLLDVHQRFTRIVLTGGGATEIAAALHELLGCTVGVLDQEGRPIVVVPPDAPDAGEVAHAAGSAAGMTHPIRVGDQHYGAIVALCGASTIGGDALVAVERAAMAVAMRQAQAAAVAEAEERFAAISLEELISGHTRSVGEVAERAASFGWDLSMPRAVLLASIDPPTDHGVLAPALSTIAAAARATLGRDAIVWTRSATIAALVAPGTDDPSERRELAEALRAELDVRLKTVTVSIGVGRRVQEPGELSRSFVEASRAVDVGRWAKGRHVTEIFDELGLERLLAATPQEDLAEFVQDAIGPLYEHDRANGTDLVETLAVWLETRNMAEAARRMHVHYNTLKNRLERIEAILGTVLTDAARALECEIAIHVARHYDGPWADLAADPPATGGGNNR